MVCTTSVQQRRRTSVHDVSWTRPVPEKRVSGSGENVEAIHRRAGIGHSSFASQEAVYSRAPVVGLEGMKEHTREAWGTAAIGSTIQDIRYGVRQLRRNRAFACSCILVLALG